MYDTYLLFYLVQRGGAWAGPAHPSMASAPTSYHAMWHYNILCTPKGQSKLDTERISKAYAAVRAAIIVVRWFRLHVISIPNRLHQCLQ